MVSTIDGNQGHGWGQFPISAPDLREFFRTFFDFLLFSSLFMGMQGIGMVYVSYLIQGITPSPMALAIMLLVPLSVYNMNRKTDEEEDSVNHPARYQFTKRFGKALEYGALIAYALAVLIAVPFGLGAVLVTLVPLVAGILYSVPLLPPRFGYRRLKEIPVMKNLVVGSSWAIIVAFLPCMIAGVPLTLQTLLTLVLFFSYVFIASAMPDMRDREGDAMAGVITIPVLIGLDRTKQVLNALNWSTAIAVIAVGICATLPPLLMALFAGTLCYTQCCITSFGRLVSPDRICDIFLDGGFVIIGSAVFLLQAIVPLLL
ncbi:MAG TPA: UbiA family prenyltransferase [Methanoregulaceae archaeon]|nr:UbiA family prenyltransferase [Methanoregulaceae archaeon]